MWFHDKENAENWLCQNCYQKKYIYTQADYHIKINTRAREHRYPKSKPRWLLCDICGLYKLRDDVRKYCSPSCSREAIRRSNIGRKYPPEFGARISLSKTGKPNLKMRGRVRSSEFRTKVSEGRRGIRVNDQTQQKINNVLKKKWSDPEFRARMHVINIEVHSRLEYREKDSSLKDEISARTSRKTSELHLGSSGTSRYRPERPSFKTTV